MKHNITFASALLIIIVSSTLTYADLQVPMLTRRVTDFTQTLSVSQQATLESRLARFEDSTSTQIAVLLIPTLGGEELSDYSLRVAEKNRIGRQGRSNGVLFLIVLNDKQMRIEVGYGLEGTLPDALSDQVLRREVRPRFRNGDYYGGILAGVEAIMKATKGEYKAEEKKEGRRGLWVPILVILFFGFAFISSLINRFRGGGRYVGGSRGWRSTGGWFGGWGGGGGGGWSGGGGGWSGGGGSFGGGGASGSW